MKRVFLVIVDALTSRVVTPAIREGRLPNLAALAERGVLREECVSIFPSITPAATAALVTGAYPKESGIAGAVWYDPDREDLAYYADDHWAILNLGVTEYFRGFLTRLNYERLQTDTVFDMAREAGDTSACVNLMWFRGPQEHPLHKPWLLDTLTWGEMPSSVMGPDVLVVGDFVRHDGRSGEEWDLPLAGMPNRWGFRDRSTSEAVLRMAEEAAFADVNVLYFPDNDFESHQVGPRESLPVVEAVDETLGQLFERFGGVDRFLAGNAIVLTGDHSHDPMPGDETQTIDLNAATPGFRVAQLGRGFGERDDVLIGPNMRAANVYFRDRSDAPGFADLVLKEPRVDQVVWSEKEAIHVRTADRGRLTFRRDDAGTPDEHGNRWSYDGNLTAVDGTVKDGTLFFGDYPNAFERLEGGCFTASGDLWLTARPGHEFGLPETKPHPGGAHGSLHRSDSVAPFIAAGFETATVPERPRITDVTSMIAAERGWR